MRIFYYFLEYPTPMYQWQRLGPIGELESAGHEVITFNPAPYPTLAEATEAALEALGDAGPIDLFMTCDDQDTIHTSVIEAASARGIPTVLICWDNIELPYKQRRIAPLFDLVWLTSAETAYLFERWGCRQTLFMPYAANPLVYTPRRGEQPIRRVGFIGSPYGSRTNKLNALTAGDIPVSVYSNALVSKGYNQSFGTGRKKFDPLDILVKASRYMRFPIGRRVFAAAILNKLKPGARLDTASPLLEGHASVEFDEMCRLYSAHTLSLNISELRDTYVLRHPIHKLHLRTFEIPMCGGLQFTSRTSELLTYFDEGTEIITYSSDEEMVDKARYWLSPERDSTVARMKEAARTRAAACHTWTARFDRIFAALGLKK